MKKIILSIVCALSTIGVYAETFNKVTDASTLKDGDKIVMGCEDLEVVSAGFYSSNKYLDKTEASFKDGVATVTSPTCLDLHKSGDYWTFTLGGKPIGNKTGKDDFDTDKKTTANFTINIDNDGYASITSQNKGPNSVTLKFWCNNTSKCFRLYSSTTQTKIQLYKLNEESVPEVLPTKVELDKESANVRLGGTLTLTAEVTPSNAADKSVTWGSIDANIATVANGIVTPVAVGTTKIWVKATAGENVTDTCIVTVLPALNTTKATYKIVQKADYLPAGAKVFFGTLKGGENFVMGRYESGNNIKGTAATYKDDAHHSVEAELQYAYTVQRTGNYYVFLDQDGKYLRTLTSSKLGNGTELDDYAKWELGEFEQDEATVELKNVGCNKNLYYNHSADLFNIYDYQGTSISSNFTRIVLFSSEAPDWVEREKHPSMVVSGEQLTQEDGEYLLDWGKQEKADNPSEDIWADSRKFTVTVTDLPEDAAVVLTADETFYCGWEEIKANRTTPAEITVFWEASKKGVYTGKLLITCDTLPTITINLHAEAVDQDTDPEYQPKIEVSAKTIYLNPNEENNYSDLQGFTFSVSNLAKKMYCKWQHTSSVLFDDESKNANMEILVGEDYLPLNGTLQFEPGQDYKDVEVLIAADDLKNGESCDTKIWFYSYAAGSKEDLVIDETVTIRVRASKAPQEDPGDPTPDDPTPDDPTPDDPTPDDPTPDDTDDGDDQAIDDVNAQTGAQKIIRNGHVYIQRNGVLYTVTGTEVRQ